jgi:hypothetical protein
VINSFDNPAGEIDYAAGIFASSATGTFDLLTITFEALAPTSNTDLTFAPLVSPRKSDAAYQGVSVLTDVVDGAVEISDETAPVITILGDNPAEVLVGDTYTDAGATAMDNVDGDLTSQIVTTSNVDTSVAGTYQVTYEVSDSSGNDATATRTVNVVEDTPLVCTTIESDDDVVVKDGVWNNVDTANASGGSYLYASGSNKDMSLMFEGSEITIVYVQDTSLGMMAIEIDGVVVLTTDTSGATEFGKEITIDYLSDGVHYLEIYPVGSDTIALDAFCANLPELSVASFSLINAENDQVIGPLSDGDVINLANLPTNKLSVRANVDPSPVGSVLFGFNGDDTHRVENVAPYALFGDWNGDYFTTWTAESGTYTVSATPFSGSQTEGFGGVTETISFTIVDTPTPLISFSPSSHSFELFVDEGESAAFSASTTDNSQPSIALSAEDNNGAVPGWLTLPPSITAGSTAQLSVSAVGLSPGTYTATVTGSAAGYGDGSFTVELTVLEPAIQFNPESFSYTLKPGDSAQDTVDVSTSSGATPTVDLSGAPSWLLLPASAPAGSSVQFTVDATGLAEGTYNATITGSSSGFASDTFTVTLEVAKPAISFDPDSFTFILKEGETDQDTVAASVADNGTPEISLSGAPVWLSMPSTITAGSSVQFMVDTTGLSVGNYSATITGSAAGYSDGFFDVTLIVEPDTPAGPAVVSFSLVDADSDTVIRELVDGETLTLSELPDSLNIQINTNPPVVGSLIIGLNGNPNFKLENHAPYTLFGDWGGNYYGGDLPMGTFTLTGTPYSEISGSGTPGESLSITLTVEP